MTSPLVSVCIAAYNAEKYISQALNSILNQSYKNLEIIVVNDGSTDGTAQILESYTANEIKIIHQKNQGQCVAANNAYKNASGSLIKFFDADDILSPDFITNQVLRIDGKTNVIASASWGRFYGDERSTFSLQNEIVYQDLLPMDWLISSMKDGANMMQCALWLIPREILERSQLWNESLSLINDFDFFIRVILASEKILFAENSILYYRSGLENSLSGSKSRKALESAHLSLTLGVERILEYEDSKRTRRICADALQLWLYEFYPQHLDLYKETKAQIKLLGGSTLAFPAGGRSKLLKQLIGWKATKHVKRLIS